MSQRSYKPAATFNPDAYHVKDLEHAKAATVGGLGNSNTDVFTTAEERWGPETVYTVGLVADHHEITSQSFLLDYGCGTGRISKGLIEQFGCEIVGADASDSMRRVAQRYVANSDRFHTCAPEKLERLQGRFDYIFCLWVLQHSRWPEDDASRLMLCLKPGARLLVCNEIDRLVPTYERGFVNDKVDVRAILKEVFGDPVDSGKLDRQHVHERFAARTYWAVYQRKA